MSPLYSIKNLNISREFNILRGWLERGTITRNFLRIIGKSPKGCYIYGKTGTGKTTAMNSFFRNIPSNAKINLHFHDYFLDISRLLTKYSMKKLVAILSRKIDLMCFDEFYIESIADARLLSNLFAGLIKKGVILVLTSNFEPEKLYLQGFNRDLIFPEFSDFLRQNLHIFHLESKVDFREHNYDKDRDICQAELPSFKGLKKYVIDYDTHKINCVTDALSTAVFEYNELFKKPRSIKEYTQIARLFNRIFIKDVPKFEAKIEDELIRFRNFIDILYTRNTILTLETKHSTEKIFETSLLSDVKIKRTQSRMKEMAGITYTSEQNLEKRKWADEARKFLQEL